MYVSAPLLGLGLPTFDGIGKILVFLVMLSVLVVLHEYGHFLMARRAGVRVDDFAVGFGPTLAKWTSKRSGTNYRINLLPIGGYCAMNGEDGKTSEAEQQRQFREDAASGGGTTVHASAGSVAVLERPVASVSPGALFSPPAARVATMPASDNFQSKSAPARLSIIVAGPVANFILAFVILLVGAVVFGTASNTVGPQVGVLLPNSPAARAGFAVGDRIVAIDGKTVTNGTALVEQIHASAGKTLHITVDRASGQQTMTVVPKATKQANGKSIGLIGFMPMPIYERGSLGKSVSYAGTSFVDIVRSQVESYVALFSHIRENAGKLSGVIGMGAEAGAIQDLGWGPYFWLAANISIALGILNLLPFPALDGGRAVFIIAEMLRGKPVQPEKEALVHVTGFAFLMLLMVVIAYHDIFNLITGKGAM